MLKTVGYRRFDLYLLPSTAFTAPRVGQLATPAWQRAAISPILALGLGSLAIGAASDMLLAQGSDAALTIPLFVADLVSLLTILCFARIGWREWQRAG